MIFIFILHAPASTVSQQCPNVNELPATSEGGSAKRLCARVYENEDCGGSYKDIFNGEAILDMFQYKRCFKFEHRKCDQSDISKKHYRKWAKSMYVSSWLPHVWNDKISSLVVSPGCTLQVYKDGSRHWFTEKLSSENSSPNEHYSSESKASLGPVFSRTISAYKCECKFELCKPSDEYVSVVDCSNAGQGDMTCTGSTNVGTSLGTSHSEGGSISETIEVGVSATIKKWFTATLGYSRTTSHDWSTTSSESYRMSHSVSSTCTVFPGRKMQLQQLVGSCSDIRVKTSHFRCVDITPNITKSEPPVSKVVSNKGTTFFAYPITCIIAVFIQLIRIYF